MGLFLKKQFVDQAVFPIQVAGAVGVRFPTGSNTEKFTDNSRIKVIRPDVRNDGNPPSPPINTPIPLAFLSSVPRTATSFPFNNGVFGRFHTDGRMPAPLQPGTGEASLFAGMFNLTVRFPKQSTVIRLGCVRFSSTSLGTPSSSQRVGPSSW